MRETRDRKLVVNFEIAKHISRIVSKVVDIADHTDLLTPAFLGQGPGVGSQWRGLPVVKRERKASEHFIIKLNGGKSK